MNNESSQSTVKGSLDLSILVPCKNEQDHVIDTLKTIVSVLSEMTWSYEIIVVDDGSTDATSARVKSYLQENPILPITLKQNARNLGLSRTFVDGAFVARGNHFRLVCGDNVESRDTLMSVIGCLGKADLIVPYHSEPAGSVLKVADLELDRSRFTLHRGGEEIRLTPKELALLELLMSAPGRVFSRQRILTNVWGIDEDPLTNVVDVYIRRLRSKVDEPFGTNIIETVRGVGYRIRG